MRAVVPDDPGSHGSLANFVTTRYQRRMDHKVPDASPCRRTRRVARRLTTAALTALAVSAVSAAIGPSAAHPQRVQKGGTFRIAFPAQAVDSIDPYLTNLPAMGFVHNATCASLLNRRDAPLPEGLSLVPELAERLPEITNRGRTYTFTVRRGYRFSTGAPVTARDIAASVKRILSPTLNSFGVQDYYAIVGARAFNRGTTAALPGVRVRGNRVRFRLTKPQPDFAEIVGTTCVLPASLPINREGARAPVPSAGPYTISRYAPGRQIVVERNRFYRGPRPHHVDRFEITLVEDQTALVSEVERGAYDWAWTQVHVLTPHVPRLAARYGVNGNRFFVAPGRGLCMFTLNASRPLFRHNPKLRRAVNYALDRKVLVRELGPRVGVATDQYLRPPALAFRDVRIYPSRPNLAKAKALARANRRSGRAVFYTRDDLLGRNHGAIVRASLAEIGIDVQVKPVAAPALFEALARRGEPFDIGWICFIGASLEALDLHAFFDGRTLDDPGHHNFSYFNSPRVNRRLDEVGRLSGRAFHRAYGELDVVIARDYAPAVAYAYLNELTFVSARTGCVVLRPALDLAAVCLK